MTVGVLDADFAQRLDCKIDEFAAGIDLAYLDCARKRRQVMDMVCPASLVINRILIHIQIQVLPRLTPNSTTTI